MNQPELTLFSTSAQKAGFRLERMEVFNWGAFHQTVYVMPLQGENALLCGANGAGKTTLVDALITLLTPNPERFYNQSAGFEDRKRIRRTEDYVLGVYGRSVAGKERLRGTEPGEGTYTVLLGVFSNKDYNQYYTLAHVYWFKNDQVQKRYYTAPVDLNIAEHFQFSGDIREFNSGIAKKYQARNYDTFTEYALDFIPKIGMRSPERSNSQAGRTKPLSLLGKTAGIKVLGNLDGFIRENMLDETDVETYFEQLKKEYADIAETQQSLDKATFQQQMLLPLVQHHTAWLTGSDELRRLDLAQRALSPWFAGQHVGLLETEVEKKQGRLGLLNEELETLDKELDALRQEDKDLEYQIRQNEAGQRLDQLKREREDLEKRRENQRHEARRYAALATSLGLEPNPDNALFFEQKKHLDRKAQDLEAQKSEQNLLRDELVGQRKELKQTIATLQLELASLRRRRNNLPVDLVEARTRICQAENIPESELPFVGELTRVKEDERLHWQYALEKLLTPFSLHLLVPPQYLPKVVQRVRDADLGVLLRFIEADDNAGESLNNDISQETAGNKLEVQPQSPFANWLRNELNRRYPHHCTSNTATYKKHTQALTPEGLYKNGKQHQKDDRKNQRTQFVLGWDNEEKLRQTEQLLRDAENELLLLEERFSPIETRIQQLDQKLADLARLHDFEHFNSINFADTELRIGAIIAQAEQLGQSSTQLKTLQTRHQQVQQAVKNAQIKRDSTLQQQTKTTGEIESRLTELRFKRNDAATLDDHSLAWRELQPLVSDLDELDLDSIGKIQQHLTNKLNSQTSQLRDQQSKIEKDLLLLMSQFKNPKKDILEAFPTWSDDTYALPEQPSIEHIGQYTDLLERIQNDQLPALRERYETRAGNDIGNAMQVFQQQLTEQLADHHENIANINRSLRTLPYSADTYLQIVCESNTRKGRIGEFYHLLKDWDYDRAAFRLATAPEQQKILRETVQRIGQLIQRLDKDPDWRREVTDIRNWLTFRTQQFYSRDDTPKPGTLLDSTGALSGGEQAKLTYTVLAAALTYQFNISADSRNAKSFRFIMIDEAFSKLDPENSTYLLDLLSSLNFQMLLITPNSNVKLSQDRMSHLIFVKKEDEMPPRSSVFVYSVMELAKIEAGKKARRG
ncbi:MAG: AAA family ATPase [Saprospiraceae bacterium]|nr:AAA family ATPase [Saprospiraceae bacterium]